MEGSDFLIALIIVTFAGAAIANYTTSVIYRLPRGLTPFEKHPHCGSCGTMLQPKDLFPIVSYWFLRGKCRYCGAKIPPSFAYVELIGTALFVTTFIVLGFNEHFLLIGALIMFWLMLAALEHNENKLFSLMLSFCFFIAALNRLLVDDSIFPMIQSGFLMCFAAMVIWRIGEPKIEHSDEATGYHVPDWAIMAALAGIALPLPYAASAMALGGVLYGAQRAFTNARFTSGPAGLAVWILLIYEHSSSNL